MQVKFQYRTNELVKGLFYSIPRSYLGKSVALLSLVLGAYFSFQPDVSIVRAIGYTLLNALITSGITLLFVIILLALAKNSRTDRRVLFDEDGMAVEYPHRTVLTKWPDIRSVFLKGNLVLLRFSNGFHMAIPRRIFSSAVEEEDFLVTIKQRIERYTSK